jgi:hypothetical protein
MLRRTNFFKQSRLLFKNDVVSSLDKINSNIDADLPTSQASLISDPPEVFSQFLNF